MAVGLGAEIARIGGSQTSLDNPRGATGFAPRGEPRSQPAESLGPGPQPELQGPLFHARPPALAELPGAALPQRGRPQHLLHRALRQYARRAHLHARGGWRARRSSRSSFPRPTTVLWRYTWRNVKVDESTLKIDPLLIPLVAQPARIAMIAANLIQDRRDDPANAHRGIYNTIDPGPGRTLLRRQQEFLPLPGAQLLLQDGVTANFVLASNTRVRLDPAVPRPIRTSRRVRLRADRRALLRRRQHVASRLPGQSGRTARSADRLSARRQRAAVPLHGTALSRSSATTSTASSSTTWAMSTRI